MLRSPISLFVLVPAAVLGFATACGTSGASFGTSGAGGGSGGAASAVGSGGASGGGGDVSGVGGSTSAAGGSGTGGSVEHAISPCAGKIYECGDGIDNDGDGLIDAEDPDCLGACDNTEDSFFPDLPGMTANNCKLDCFWDHGNGSGSGDECYWDHRCDPLAVAPDYPPEGAKCAYNPSTQPKPGMSCSDAMNAQSQTCLDFCGPLVPNGCDCFGCCELPSGSGKFVWLGAVDGSSNGTCTIDDVGDPAKCPPCTPVPGCHNDCDVCELCIGRTELPEECEDPEGGDPPGKQCPDGVQACGLEGQDPCPSGKYCITGCCMDLIK